MPPALGYNAPQESHRQGDSCGYLNRYKIYETGVVFFRRYLDRTLRMWYPFQAGMCHRPVPMRV